MRHNFCARCGQPRGGLLCVGDDGDWYGPHIWAWSRGDSIIPFPSSRELVERLRREGRGD